MPETYTSGMWRVKPGEEEAFVEAWRAFAGWASGMDGVTSLRLTRDVKDPANFFSFAPWESIEAIRAWKGSDELKQRIGRVKTNCDEFAAWEFELVTVVGEEALATG